MQTSTIDLALRDTQTRLYALDTQNIDEKFSVDDGFNIKKVRVQNFADTGALKFTVSTYDVNDMTLREGEYGIGRRVVTFNNMLKYDAFPLAKVLEFMLSKGESAMGRPVEIEFAGMVDAKGEMKGQIYWLQIRPIVDRREMLDENIMECTDDKLLLKTFTALGHGMMDNLYSVVYIRPEHFSSLNNSAIAREIEKINSNFTAQERNYILVGPGRWGSSDTALGIPVKWAHISSAKLIVESALPGYRIEPSQGTHFFQNLTSFGVGYFTVDPSSGDGTVFDVAFLDSMPAEYESEMVRIVTFNKPLMVGINGKKGLGVVLKPDIE